MANSKQVRCGWCGKTFKPTKDKRIPSHKADRDWEYRDDDRCPGSKVLIKHLAPQAVTTHPQALARRRNG